MPLAPADRTKLAAVLGLLGSPHQGERDAAALAADRLVRKHGLSWGDVLAPQPQSVPHPETSRRREPPAPPEWTHRPPTDHWSDLQVCAQRPDLLSTWETQYLRSIWYTPRPSPKQRRIIADIAAKVRAAGPRAG